MSQLENDLAALIKLHGLPEPLREYRFCERRWRFDFAWPAKVTNWMVAAECEGGTWASGRHTRGQGFEADCAKYNQATLNGWHVYRFTASMIESGEAIRTLKRALGVSD